MTVPPFERLTRDQKEFWCGMVGADPDNAICAQACIDLWSGPDHFDNRDRAILELIGWLVITREQFDTPAVGHA